MSAETVPLAVHGLAVVLPSTPGTAPESRRLLPAGNGNR